MWFGALDHDLQAAVRARLRERTIAADAFVCRRDEPSRNWFGVIEGLVKVCNTSVEGRPVTFAGIPPGAWFGEGTVMKGGSWSFDAVALRASRVACLPATLFDELLARSRRFNRFVLEHMNERLGQMTERIENDRLTDPTLRVARCLAAMFNPPLYPLPTQGIPITHEEIGYLSRATRQKVNRALCKMEELCLLSVTYGRVNINDPDSLRDFAARRMAARQ